MNRPRPGPMISEFLEDSMRTKMEYQNPLFYRAFRSPGLPPPITFKVELPKKTPAPMSVEACVKPTPQTVYIADEPVKCQEEKPAKQKLLHKERSEQQRKTTSPKKKSSQRPCHEPIAAAFPAKLFHLIERAAAGNVDHIISFLPEGKAFQIHDPSRFAQEVLPLFSKSTRFPSFLKQLNLYGFKRGPISTGSHVYCHEFFQRDSKRLLAKIQRQRLPPPNQRNSASTPAAAVPAVAAHAVVEKTVMGGIGCETGAGKGTSLFREQIILTDALNAARKAGMFY